jgi:hypothetical protein
MVGNDFVRICTGTKVRLRYPTCGQSIQLLQSVKSIQIDMFMLLYELQFGHLASVCGMDDFYGVSCFWSVAVVVLLIFIALIESPT